MTDHMSTCAQGISLPSSFLSLPASQPHRLTHASADPNSPVQAYKPSKLAKLLHPRSSRSDVAGRQDRQALAMQAQARRTESETKSW